MGPTRAELAPLLRTGLISPPRQPRRPTLEIPRNSLLRPWLAVPRPVTPSPERPQITKRLDHNDLVVRNTIFGFFEGLMVAFALTAGLSALGDTNMVVMAGLANIFGGMLSLGLGAYFAVLTERQHWEAELVRKTDQVIDNAPFQRAETYDILLSYGIHHRDADWAINKLTEHANSHKWARFMMHFNLGIPEPDADPRRAAVSAALLAGGYFAGGLVPVVPYCFFVGGGGAAVVALAVSVGFTVVVLAVAGFGKTWVALQDRKAAYWGAGQAVVVGAVAAGVSYGVVCLLDLVIGFITGGG